MAKLVEKFMAKVSKSKITGSNNEATFDVAYSTGFLAIDFINGTTVHVDDGKGMQFSYVSAGITDGSCNTIIGRSGSGKSTLMTQIVGNMARNMIKKGYDTIICDDDLEGSLPEVRKEFLFGLPKEVLEECLKHRNEGITSENLYERIRLLADEKMTNKKDYIYDTELYDTYGNRIYKLIPSFYMVDSLPMLMPESLANDDELGSSMDASAIAKQNTMLFKKIAQLCKASNIIFFTINHILDEIQMGFIPKAAQISGLKQGERLPGGKAALYLANNMFRVDDSTTLKESEGFGINGSIVTLTVIKSRTNATKRSVPLIFNKTTGRFDEELSLFQLLKQEGRIAGAGAYSYLEECPDIKFSQKTFKSVLNSSPELRQAFAKEVFNVLSPYLSDTKTVSAEDNNTTMDITNMVLNMGSKIAS